MNAHVSLFSVQKIRVVGHGGPSEFLNGAMRWWQTIDVYDAENNLIGSITLHLNSADAALPIGEQPPYWGIDPKNLPAMLPEDESPL